MSPRRARKSANAPPSNNTASQARPSLERPLEARSGDSQVPRPRLRGLDEQGAERAVELVRPRFSGTARRPALGQRQLLAMQGGTPCTCGPSPHQHGWLRPRPGRGGRLEMLEQRHQVVLGCTPRPRRRQAQPALRIAAGQLA